MQLVKTTEDFFAVVIVIRIYSLLLLLSRFSRVRLCVTPEMAARQAPPSMGFSRQEHWNGLPLPSPYTRWQYIINLLVYAI